MYDEINRMSLQNLNTPERPDQNESSNNVSENTIQENTIEDNNTEIRFDYQVPQRREMINENMSNLSRRGFNRPPLHSTPIVRSRFGQMSPPSSLTPLISPNQQLSSPSNLNSNTLSGGNQSLLQTLVNRERNTNNVDLPNLSVSGKKEKKKTES